VAATIAVKGGYFTVYIYTLWPALCYLCQWVIVEPRNLPVSMMVYSAKFGDIVLNYLYLCSRQKEVTSFGLYLHDWNCLL